MSGSYFAILLLTVGTIALGPAVLEIKRKISNRVERKDSR